MAICRTVEKIEYSITMKDGRLYMITTSRHHEDMDGFIALMPKGEATRVYFNYDCIEQFKWEVFYAS